MFSFSLGSEGPCRLTKRLYLSFKYRLKLDQAGFKVIKRVQKSLKERLKSCTFIIFQ